MAVGIFDSISTTKTHNRALEVKRVAFYDTFYTPMIEVQMRLYKTNGVIYSFL